MEPAVAIFLGAVVAVLVVGGLLWAFIADRRRNEDVAHDPERLEQPDQPDQSDQPGLPDQPDLGGHPEIRPDRH